MTSPCRCSKEVRFGWAARYAPRDRDHLAQDVGSLTHHPQLSFLRIRRSEALTPHAVLPDPGPEELSLCIGLHNTLVFDHPDRARVWARSSTWRRAEGATRTMLTLPFPTDVGEGLVRHLWVGAFIDLMRTDTIVASAVGEARFLGQDVPRRRFRFGGPPPGAGRTESVRWLVQPHAPETQRLLEDAMRASPLTCLLQPQMAPPGWSPLWAQAFLRQRGLARAVCHEWAQHKDWISVGGAVMSGLLPSLPSVSADADPPPAEPAAKVKVDGDTQDSQHDGPLEARPSPRALPGAVVPSGPEALSAVVGALIHLHFLKVLELDARLGVALGSRDPGIMGFLALPLLLPYVGEVMGTPLGALPRPAPCQRQPHRRARGLVPPTVDRVRRPPPRARPA